MNYEQYTLITYEQYRKLSKLKQIQYDFWLSTTDHKESYLPSPK